MKISIKKTIISLGTTVALASSIGAVQAADLPPPATRVAAPVLTAPAHAYDWSGFYAGLHAGWGFADIDWDRFGPAPFTPIDVNADGFIGGGLLGYNFQAGVWVFGVEGDITFGDVDGSGGGAPKARAEVDFMATIRGRVGYAFDNLLLFATAGVGFAELDPNDPGSAAPTNPSSKTHTGWVVGGGLDWAFSPNLIGRGEYMYGDYEKKSYGIGAFADPISFETHVVRAALIWKF